MADRDCGEAEEDTEELLYTDVIDNTGVFGLDRSPLKLDHCGLLLDAIDAQLSQQQIQTQKCEEIPMEPGCRDSAPQRWSSFLSKDKGLGSQTNYTPKSCHDLTPTPMKENKSEGNAGCRGDGVTHEQQKLPRRGKDETESQRELIVWRLKRLLGDTCDEGQIMVESQPPSESICTEDFLRRFTDEMVELTLPETDMRQDAKEEAEAAGHDTCQRERKEQNILDTWGNGAATLEKSNKDCHRTENVQQSETPFSKVKTLAGVPVWSFDYVSIDSDHDSVCTEQVRQHIHRQSGWCSLTQTDKNIDDSISESDSDTPTQEKNEAQPISGQIGQRSSYGCAPIRGHCVCKALHNNRETYRERNHQSSKCRPESTLEKMQSHWFKLKDHPTELRQKCEKEEETLQAKRFLLKHAELSLSQLQQRRKHAVQELERLTVEKSKMEKENKCLECVLRNSRNDCVSRQQHKLQKQRATGVHEEHSVVMSVLEREEMDRQLDCAKTQLFSEQRHAREKLESMQEKLEETCEDLRMATEVESRLRSRCASMEEKQLRDKEQIQAAELHVGRLQNELGECTMRKEVLEATLAQKELQLLNLQEQHADRNGLKGELQHLKALHSSTLAEAQEQNHRMMLKEEEANKLKDSLDQQKQEAKSREEQLHEEALEQVNKALEEERRKWEAEKVKAVQFHCRILEEQNRQRLESMNSAMQREKSQTLSLQHEVVELTTKVQELQSVISAQKRQQERLLAVICKSLKEEHQAELQGLQKIVAQDRPKAVLQLELAEKEADRLRVTLEEKENNHNQIRAEAEQQLQHWAQDLQAECQNLHLLVVQSGANHTSVKFPPCPTIPEALTNLRILREQLKNTTNHLHQELESQKQTNEHMRKHKEQELRIQMQELRIEREQALKTLKEQLIQEHIEELSSLKWAHMCDGRAEGGAAASLRKQLKAKDMELRQVHRRMAQWKEQTAARLACKFEEELTSELERKTPKSREERQTTCEKPEGQTDCLASGCSPPHHVAATPSDMTSFKLLRYLQARVKQLRMENQANTWSLSPINTVPSNLSGSYLTTITKGRDMDAIQSQSSSDT